MFARWRLLAVGAVALASLPSAVLAGDSPAGFYYGTDTNSPTVSGSPPYQEPSVGGTYGGYIGEWAGWGNYTGCFNMYNFNTTNASDADTNLNSYGSGVGAGDYYALAGPGLDPNYNGTTSEAATWGTGQAEYAVSVYNNLYSNGSSDAVYYKILFADVEGSDNSDIPYSSEGWNTVWAPGTCGQTFVSNGIPLAVDQAEINAFVNYINNDGGTAAWAGVYSSSQYWTYTFGSGFDISTWEWTYENQASLSPGPSGWCEGSTCGQFFGGVSSSSGYAAAWQWSNAATNGNVGDWDQIDTNNQP